MLFEKKVFGLFASLGLLIIPATFPASFKLNLFTIFLYQSMIAVGIFGLIYYLSFVVKKRRSLIFLVFLLFEISVYGVFKAMQTQIDLPSSIELFFRNFNIDSFRNAPVFHEELGKYDQHLFYTLNPGQANFKCWEYDTPFNVNSLGFRDDENSLQKPEIICLGDSFTMGWGVNQEKSFPQLIEQKTQSKTLNMGIASYGTARELIALKKVDLQNVKTIILQFCMNDIWENRVFVENDFHLPISSKKYYHESAMQNKMNISYYPFKFSFELLARFPRGIKRDYFNKSTAIEKEKFKKLKSIYVQDFFQILQKIKEQFSGQIILFSLETIDSEYDAFSDFQQYLYIHPEPNLTLLNTNPLFDSNDYFVIDGHLNSKGHQKLSDFIFNKLNTKFPKKFLSTSKTTR